MGYISATGWTGKSKRTVIHGPVAALIRFARHARDVGTGRVNPGTIAGRVAEPVIGNGAPLHGKVVHRQVETVGLLETGADILPVHGDEDLGNTGQSAERASIGLARLARRAGR